MDGCDPQHLQCLVEDRGGPRMGASSQEVLGLVCQAPAFQEEGHFSGRTPCPIIVILRQFIQKIPYLLC